MSRRISLIGIDPGFASIGIAVLLLDADYVYVTRFELLKTESETKKRKVFAVEDNVRRALEIARHLRVVVAAAHANGATVAGICAEAMSFPRNSSAAAKMAMTWGIIASLSEATSIPIVQASPQRVKIDVCGSKSASKDDVIAAVEKLYPQVIEARRNIARSAWEHPHDALAVAHASLDSEAVKIARRMIA